MPSTPILATACDEEPIHLLGAIQPMGFLLSVNADWIVVRASTNLHSYLGVTDTEVIGRPIGSFISAKVLHDVRGQMQAAGQSGVVERLFGQQLAVDSPCFDISVHQSGCEFILEFERSQQNPEPTSSRLRAMISRVERHHSAMGMYKEAARQVRALTGLDRVMVYRFDEDGSGEVVAEATKPGLPPFLGPRYPASDIPQQARALYERNFIRTIEDVDADPVPVMPVLSPEGERLDLSMSSLRSVSPVHIEYLRNMGVRSSMSISILRRKKLWGLIACHHATPKHLGPETRTIAELFGQMVSYLLEIRQQEDEARYDARVHDIHNRIATAFAEPNGSLNRIPQFIETLSDYVACDAVGAYYAGEVVLVGPTPAKENFLQLVRFLNKTASGSVFSTHRLSEIFPPAADFVPRIEGILSIPISRTPRDYLIFFRREVVKTVTWAGQPVKDEVAGPDGVRVIPRKSFEAWPEIVRHQSEHWAGRELRAAEALRITLVDVLLRLSDQAQADRLDAQHRQELLIAELNHRVRNTLGLVRGLVTQSAASTSDVQILVKRVDDRIRSFARAHDLVTSGNWKSASLHRLVFAEIEAYSVSDDRVVREGPDVLLQPKALLAMALVVHELVTNACKYGALSVPAGQIRIKVTVDDIDNVAVSWTEAGGPVVVPPTRRGFGSTILEQSIPFEVNGVSTPRYTPTGFCFDMVLPAAVAQIVQAPGPATVAADHAIDAVEDPKLEALLAASLVVEDNLFIAVDVEDLLRMLGAQTVDVVRSVSEACEILSRQRFTFALLDINLGHETSFPIAEMLQRMNIPFAFGTGYGERLALAETLADVPIVTKPYHRDALIKVLTRLLPDRSYSQ
jgi:light-regulated signal transduction histidine kinase (bacteriophytochrome)/CheY-like chemotaxis protein